MSALPPGIDEDAFMAAVDLIGRTGARGFEVGYVHDDVPVTEAGWYAHAQYRGARITEEDHRGPVEASEALARRLLTGAQCQGCGGLVALGSGGAVAFDSVALTDGTRWTVEEAAAAGQCRWTRLGRKWVSSCGLGADKNDPPPGPNRRRRRAAQARARRRPER